MLARSLPGIALYASQTWGEYPVIRHAAIMATAGAILFQPAAAQSLLPGDVYTLLTVEALSAPNPVLGADERIHLAYEVVVSNPTRLFTTLDKVEAIDGDGTVHWSLEGDRLKAMTVAWAQIDGSIPPGGMAVVLLDASFARGAALPGSIATRVTTTRRIAGPNGAPVPLPANAAVPPSLTFTAGHARIGAPAVAIDPPLRGAGWIVVNGCCDAPVSHRTGFQAINAGLKAPERFAIDWMRLDQKGRLFAGDGSKLEDYSFYGQPVYAVADGKVVNARDGLDPQVPMKRDPNIKPDDITGNTIVLDIGGGHYALYAHLLKGSLKVKVGDRVKAGQELAQVGNSGNSDGPHLHFQVMDGPGPLDSNGLPFVIRSFASPGVLQGGSDAAFDAAMAGKPATIDPRLGGKHTNALPLNNQVVDF